MCELTACFALATWYLDAFNTAGYIYPTGPAGSGKTQFLMLMCMVAHLGEFVQASGSFAAIRDASDYGAFLGFDDAENVTSNKFDPDKRNILLSGTTRGSQVTLKEPDPSGRGWVTRYVDTYAFRGFSAIRSPDNTLGSRTITIPLIRTTNKTKGDADPQDENLWPTPLKRLRGDLWQVALTHLVEMRVFERKAKLSATLTARALQPWTGVFAVAAFLDSRKEDLNLFKRMDQLSVKYQNDRAELETADISRLILRAIVYCIAPDVSEPFSIEQIIRSTTTREWLITSAQITEECRHLIEAEELDFDLELINSRRIGRAVGKLRIPKKSNGKNRGWQIHAEGLEKHLKSHALLTSAYVSDVIYHVDVNNESDPDDPKTSQPCSWR
jgi:hypothetical protein